MDIDVLADRFAQRCKTDLARLQLLRDTGNCVGNPDLRDELIFIAHRIAGSGTLFGFADASAKGHRLEAKLMAHELDEAEALAALDSFIDSLDDIIR